MAGSGILAILTLERHKDGIWITRLVSALENVLKKNHNQIIVRVVVLEQLLSDQPICISSLNNCNLFVGSSGHNNDDDNTCDSTLPWIGIVNRVSDAAEPHLVKACCGILQAAQHLYDIPIVNGPQGYSLMVNKWCHHMFFTKANLQSPCTVATMLNMNNKIEDKNKIKQALVTLQKKYEEEEELERMVDESGIQSQERRNKKETESHFEFLMKPNSGGFGVGIERYQIKLGPPTSLDTLSSAILPPSPPKSTNINNSSSYSDSMILFQTSIKPKNNKYYRVWFLLGKIQCATERTIIALEKEKSSASSRTEFTSGCAASSAASGKACSLESKHESSDKSQPQQQQQQIKVQYWEVTSNVRCDIEEKLLPILPKDVHCGSIEFMYDSKTNQRLYFDLNLLSTLPLSANSTTAIATKTTGVATDSWIELAYGIQKIIFQTV